MYPSMIFQLKRTIIVLSLFGLCLASSGHAQQASGSLTISDIRLSNFGGNNFVVSWRTSIPTEVNELLLGLAPDQLTIVRGDQLDSPGRLHYVQVVGADITVPDTTYYFKVRSDGLEGSAASTGYDSIMIRPQAFVSPGATIQGYVVKEHTGEPVPNAIVRSYYNWTRTLSGVTTIDSSMWYAVLTNDEGKFNISLSNYRKYNGQSTPYVPGASWMHLEVMGEYETLAPDSVLLPFAQNSIGEFTILDTLEISRYTFPGDLDGNSSINTFDLLEMLNVLGGGSDIEPWKIAAADLDGNGKVDVFDLLKLLLKIKSTGTVNS